MTLWVSEEVGVSQGAEARMCWSLQKVSGPAWSERGPEWGSVCGCSLIIKWPFGLISSPTTVSPWGHGLGWLVACFP